MNDTQTTESAPKLGVVAGSLPSPECVALVEAIKGYMAQRQILIDQLTTEVGRAWNGTDKAIKTLREDMKVIDDHVARLLLANAVVSNTGANTKT